MSRTTSTLFCAVFLLILGCKKKVSEPAPFKFPFDGIATGHLNGLPWSAKVTAGYFVDNPKSFSLSIVTTDERDQREHFLGITAIPLIPEIDDTLYNFSYSEGITVDSPRLGAYYQRYFANDDMTPQWMLDLSRPHTVKIAYDAVKQTITGSIEASFISPYDTMYAPWSRPVHFTELKFTSKVHHYDPGY